MSSKTDVESIFSTNDGRNLRVTSYCQFDKEGMWSFRYKAKKRGGTTFERERVGSFHKNKKKYLFRERELMVFIRMKLNIFLKRGVHGFYYKNKN